jgi:hypothetical protein
MREYIVYRVEGPDPGPGLAQGDKRAVARLFAAGPEEAIRQAAPGVTLRPGQRLTAEPAEEVDAREEEIDRPARAPEATPEA